MERLLVQIFFQKPNDNQGLRPKLPKRQLLIDGHSAIGCICGYIRPCHRVHPGMYMYGVTATQEALQQLGLPDGIPHEQKFVCVRCQRRIESIQHQHQVLLQEQERLNQRKIDLEAQMKEFPGVVFGEDLISLPAPLSSSSW
jgi:hypothetical protein